MAALETSLSLWLVVRNFLFVERVDDTNIPFQHILLRGSVDEWIWGWLWQAFPKGSQLAIDISTAILELAESGQLQRIHDLWLTGEGCTKGNVQLESNELGLSTFWGLFLITGSASLLCCLAYWARMVVLHRRLSRGRLSAQVVPLALGRCSISCAYY